MTQVLAWLSGVMVRFFVASLEKNIIEKWVLACCYPRHPPPSCYPVGGTILNSSGHSTAAVASMTDVARKQAS